MGAGSDEELIRAFRDGNDAALGALYDRHHAWAASVAFRFTRDRDEALDLLQDAFTYLLRRRTSLEPGTSLKALLYTILKHRAIDLGSRKKRPLALDFNPPAPSTPDAGDIPLLLKDLNEGQREVVLLRFVDGLDLAAIAAALEVPLGTVKSRLHGALDILRRNPPPIA